VKSNKQQLNKRFQEILSQYPKYVSKEQMRIICHISKRKARYLLQSGLVPCENSGKLTRNYKIKTADVVKYLQDREELPEKYKYEQSSSNTRYIYSKLAELGTDIESLSAYYEELFKDYLDIVTVADIAQMTGFTRGSVTGWLKDKKIKSFKIKNVYRVPKIYLLKFLVSNEYRRLGIRTEKQKLDMEGLMIWYREKQSQ